VHQEENPYSVIHSSSILSSAIGESGLQAYKFGKSVTLASWKKNYEPITTLEVIRDNLERQLHTLVFVDLDNQNPMQIRDIKSTFEKMSEKSK